MSGRESTSTVKRYTEIIYILETLSFPDSVNNYEIDILVSVFFISVLTGQIFKETKYLRCNNILIYTFSLSNLDIATNIYLLRLKKMIKEVT